MDQGLTISDELDLLHGRLEPLLLSGDFARVEAIMEVWDFSSPPDLAVGLLAMTLPFASCLPGRARFFSRSRKALSKVGRLSLELDGLSGRPPSSSDREVYVVERLGEDGEWAVDASNVGAPGTGERMRSAYCRPPASSVRIVRYVPDEWADARDSLPELGAEVDFVSIDGAFYSGTWTGAVFHGVQAPMPGEEVRAESVPASEVLRWRPRPSSLRRTVPG